MVAALEPVPARQSARSQEDGTLVLPAEARDALEIRADEDILLFKTEQGILVTTRKALMNWALDGIGAALHESGVTLDELMESGAEIRQQIFDEKYASRSST